MHVYVAFKQFVTTCLQFMGIVFVEYIFRIYGYIFRCIVQQLEGIFGEISEFSSLLHLEPWRRSTFFRDLFWWVYNANEKMLVCRSLCVCLYLCVQIHTRFIYTCALKCKHAMSVLYTHAHDMRVYIWTGSAGAFADGKFRHKDEKEGRIRNTDNDRDRYSDRLHYPFWRPGFLVCRLSWLVWAVCKKLSLIVIRLWSFWVWPFWRSRTIKRHLLPCPVGISIKTTILTLVACGEWSIDHEYVRRVKDWGTV